jgi:hypothetical protein
LGRIVTHIGIYLQRYKAINNLRDTILSQLWIPSDGITRHEAVSNPHAEDHIQYLLRLQEAAKDAIADTQQIQQRHANRHRSEVSIIKEGDWILLQRKQSERWKLAPIADGPFKVISIGTNAVTLKLPKNLRAHPMVNISRVQLYFGPRPEILTESPKDNTQHEYEVDHIMG